MSLVVRKPVFSNCENKDADQLRSNCENKDADQLRSYTAQLISVFVFTTKISTIPLLSKSEISSF